MSAMNEHQKALFDPVFNTPERFQHLNAPAMRRISIITIRAHYEEDIPDRHNFLEWKSDLIYSVSRHNRLYQAQPMCDLDWMTMEEEYEWAKIYDNIASEYWNYIKYVVGSHLRTSTFYKMRDAKRRNSGSEEN